MDSEYIYMLIDTINRQAATIERLMDQLDGLSISNMELAQIRRYVQTQKAMSMISEDNTKCEN